MTELHDLVARALAEDLGSGDVTAEAVVPADASTTARIIQKAPGVISGFAAAAEAFQQAGAERFESLVGEGEWADEIPRDIAIVSGPARAILAGERTALNFLAHLSGVATLTAQFVEAARPGRARVLDTRKTTPGLRALEKAAVAAGGADNHRMGLYDAILIKENHSALAGGVAEAVRRSREAQPGHAGRDRGPRHRGGPSRACRRSRAPAPRQHDHRGAPLRGQRRAMPRQADGGPRAELEASGGVSLSTTPEIASTGVDFISVGALTHSAPALDLSLLFDEPSLAA